MFDILLTFSEGYTIKLNFPKIFFTNIPNKKYVLSKRVNPHTVADLAQILGVFKIVYPNLWKTLKIGALENHGNKYFTNMLSSNKKFSNSAPGYIGDILL